MGESLIPIRPAWLDHASAYHLPLWFDSRRVQLHTRLFLRTAGLDPDLFFKAGERFKAMGAHVITRHIVSSGEGAWWPSRYGDVLPEAVGRNLAQEIIDDAHRNDLKIIVYYRHIENAWAAKQHPDWQCVDAAGQPIAAPRGVNMCLNTPYADFVLNRQLELVEMGADGFYYDSVHMPRSGCWCRACRAKFRELSGHDHPVAADVNDPLWHQLKEFNNNTMALTFLRWRQALHQRNPNVVMVVGSNVWPGSADKHQDHRIFRLIDSHKTEYDKGLRAQGKAVTWPMPRKFRAMDTDVRLALGFTLARDAADGRPAHVWMPGLRDEAHALASTAAVLTHGCIANLDVKEQDLPDMRFQPALALGDHVSPHLAGSRPWRWATVLHSELTRDAYALDSRQMWRRVLYPLYGAFHVLMRLRLPVGFITDSQLEEGRLEDSQVLFVPDDSLLTSAMRQAVQTFQAKGGLVIVNHLPWNWQLEENWASACENFRAALGPALPKAPVQALGGPEKMQMAAYVNAEKRQLVVCLTNDITWTRAKAKGLEGAEADEEDADETTPVELPPPCQGVSVRLRGPETPRHITEALSGQTLTARAQGQAILVDVPTFQHLACVVVQY